MAFSVSSHQTLVTQDQVLLVPQAVSLSSMTLRPMVVVASSPSPLILESFSLVEVAEYSAITIVLSPFYQVAVAVLLATTGSQ